MNEEQAKILQDIHESTTQMRTYLFGMNRSDGFINQTNAKINAQGRRIRSLEIWKYAISGAWSVVTALFGWHALGGNK